MLPQQTGWCHPPQLCASCPYHINMARKVIKGPRWRIWCLLQPHTSSKNQANRDRLEVSCISSKNQACGFDVSCNFTHHQRTTLVGLMSLATKHIIKEPSLWVWCLLQPYTSSKNWACGFDVSCNLTHHQRTRPWGLMSLAVSHVIKGPSLRVWHLLEPYTSSKNQALGFDVSCSLARHQRTTPDGLTSLGILHIIKEPSLRVWCLLESYTSSKNQAWGFGASCNLTHYQRTKPVGLVSLAISGVKSLKKQSQCLWYLYLLQAQNVSSSKKEKIIISKFFETGLQQSWREKEKRKKKKNMKKILYSHATHLHHICNHF